MSAPLSTHLFAIAVFLLAGMVKGVIGLGLPTIAMGLLGVVMLPVQAAALLLLPSFVTNVWQAMAGAALPRLLLRLWPMLLASCLGTWAGADLMAGNGRIAAGGLGLALITYALWGMAAPQFSLRPRDEFWTGLLAGGVTGVVTAATGVFVLPAVPYLQALRLEKDELVQALGISFTVSTLALAASLTRSGHVGLDMAGLSALMLLPALLGMAVGQWVRQRISPVLFRRCFFASLLLLGSYITLRSLFG